MDTAGTEQFTSMRELYMREAQGFLLVFSITSSSSLQELQELRDQIVHVKNDPSVPIVLVGNKCDLEDDRRVPRQRALQVGGQWGHVPYYETSARRRHNVHEVFVDVCTQMVRRDQATLRTSDAPHDRHRRQGGGGGGGGRRAVRPWEEHRHHSRRRNPCTIL